MPPLTCAKTKGKVERPYRYVRQDFFLARTFRDMDDLNAQFDAWRGAIANARTPPPRALAIVLGPMADDGSPWPSTSSRSSRP